MEDLRFWRLLHEAPTVELVPFLLALAERPLKERIPYLGLLPRVLKAGETELRHAALCALQGANGRKSLQLMLDHFQDPDPGVAIRAVESFARSISRDPLRWAHAVFHPRLEIRRLAAAQKESSGLAIHLLGDPDCAPFVRLPGSLPQNFAPTVLEWVQRGVLEPSVARTLLGHPHLTWLLTSPDSSADAARMLSLFWNDEAPAAQLWDRLSEWLDHTRHESYRAAIADLILELGGRHANWPAAPRRLLFNLRPLALVDAAIPRADRYLGLETLYRSAEHRRLCDDDLPLLLSCDLVRDGNGVDLWALGAVLCATRHPHRILDALPFQTLVDAAGADPLALAFLFLAPRFQPAARKLFSRRLAEATEGAAAIAAGLLAAGDSEAARPLLKARPVAVAEALFELEGRAGFRLTPSTRARIVTTLVEACSTQPRLLMRGLRGPLAQDCLTELAGKLEGEAFLEQCLAMTGDALVTLLQTIDHTPSFPYAVEGHLVHELASHPHPEVKAWSEARTLKPVTSGRRPPASAIALSQAEQAAIADCAEGELPAALAPALKAPSRDLVGSLATRAAGGHRALVSQALIGCHDPVHAVAEQLQRFGAASDNDVMAWTYQPDLPLHGHCRLDRFDFHTDRVELEIHSLRGLVEPARELGGPVSEALWRMAARLCSRWRFRDSQKLARMVDEALVAQLVEALEEYYPRQAAICLSRLWQAETHTEALVRLRPRVLELLPDLDQQTRLELHGYVSSKGMAGPTIKRRGGISDEDLYEVRRCTELERLGELALDARGEIVAEAALRLLEFGETGAGWLLELLAAGHAPQAPLIAETAGLWPEGACRTALIEMVRAGELEAEVVFAAGLSLMEVGEPLRDAVLQAACRPAGVAWFLKSHWDRLLRCGLDQPTLSLHLAASPHPHAYGRAVEFATEANLPEPLARFLEAGWDRLAVTRQQVARRLWDLGDERGFPLVFQQALETPERELELGRADLRAAVDSVMLAGAAAVPEKSLVDLMLILPAEALATIAPLVLRQSRQPETCQTLLNRLPRTTRRQEMLTRVARTFLWGVKMGRQLTGRLFAVEMHGGEELGFTRLEESSIYVNPLPMFRGDRHGQEVVEGLILHELGHHVYHRGPQQSQVWRSAEASGLFPLLNIVSDEHLERNLRSMNAAFDQKLKRLAAFAFLHNKREVDILQLLVVLQHKAAEVLIGTPMSVAGKAGCVALRSGDVFQSLEKHGSSFMRFFRGLRTGRGNRHGDPLVAQALGLFPSAFRGYSLEQQLEIAVKLRELFGRDAQLAQVLSQDRAHCPDSSEVIVVGEGLTPDEMRREIERLSRVAESSPNPTVGSRWLNKCDDSSFPPLTTVVPVPFDHGLARDYSHQVARHAHRLREVFSRLGLTYQRETRRVKGHRVDRARLPDAMLRGEVRILQARRLVVNTDLFLGVLVDCSGSMHGDCIHKARLFATLVARAVDGLAGVDLRVLGFTDSVIFDAGSAHRCSAHSLQAGGGNNDAGALDFAAHLARRSRRRARLLIMISDGLPTQCSVIALSELVARLTRKERILCAQVAVRPLKEVCFPHYIELSGGPDSLGLHVAEFGRVVARLASRSLR